MYKRWFNIVVVVEKKRVVQLFLMMGLIKATQAIIKQKNRNIQSAGHQHFYCIDHQVKNFEAQ